MSSACTRAHVKFLLPVWLLCALFPAYARYDCLYSEGFCTSPFVHGLRNAVEPQFILYSCVRVRKNSTGSKSDFFVIHTVNRSQISASMISKLDMSKLSYLVVDVDNQWRLQNTRIFRWIIHISWELRYVPFYTTADWIQYLSLRVLCQIIDIWKCWLLQRILKGNCSSVLLTYNCRVRQWRLFR